MCKVALILHCIILRSSRLDISHSATHSCFYAAIIWCMAWWWTRQPFTVLCCGVLRAYSLPKYLTSLCSYQSIITLSSLQFYIIWYITIHNTVIPASEFHYNTIRHIPSWSDLILTHTQSVQLNNINILQFKLDECHVAKHGITMQMAWHNTPSNAQWYSHVG